MGAASYDLRTANGGQRIVSISQGPADPRGLVDCLQLHLSDGTRIDLLPGRDAPELHWVAGALTVAMGISDDAPRS